ncbi:MAG: PDZ domain-containing protein [Ferruginibacter sp.]
MKKIFFAFLPCIFTAFSFEVMAQEDLKPGKDSKNKKESQEIVIRTNGNKNANLNIQINGDKVTVNGKPLTEFKDDQITVNKRDVIVRDGDRIWHGEGMGEGGNLGRFWSDNEDDKSAFLGVTTEKTKDGAEITDLTEESAAAKAGLLEGDVITNIGDVKIDGPESLSKAIRAKKPKDEVQVTYLRDGKEKRVKATLQERKRNPNVFSFSTPDGSYKTLTIPAVPKVRDYTDIAPMPYIYDGQGFDMTFGPRKKLGLKIQDTEEGNGVKVLDVEDSSAASAAGVKKDDILIEIGGVKVTNTDEVREELNENREKSSYNIKARRNGKELSFDIKIPKKLKTANL